MCNDTGIGGSDSSNTELANANEKIKALTAENENLIQDIKQLSAECSYLKDTLIMQIKTNSEIRARLAEMDNEQCLLKAHLEAYENMELNPDSKQKPASKGFLNIFRKNRSDGNTT